MTNIVIFGAPGSGKGTQSAEIIRRYGYEHISTGELLRHEISVMTPLGVIAKEYIDKGCLVPDDLIIHMIEHIIDSHQGAKGIIFDGFPRTVPQAKALSKLLYARGSEVHLMIDLDVPEDILISRLLDRAKVSGRSDDNLNIIQHRLDVYHTQTAPISDFYRKLGRYKVVQATGTVMEIADRVAGVIDSTINHRIIS